MIKRIGALVFALTLLFAFAVPASADYDTSYTYYESLTASGSQYLDTGINGSSDLRVVIDFILDETKTNYLFGSESTSADKAGLSFFVLFGSEYAQAVVGSQALNFDSYSYGSLNTFDFNIPAGTATLNGSTLSITPYTFSNSTPLYLFGFNSNGTAARMGASTIYSCRIYVGGQLVRSYIPASSSSGVYGMWDDYNNVFTPLVGSGTAVPGDVWVPVVPGDGPSVSEIIDDFNTQIHEIEQTIYEDLHTYSSQVDPSTATNFSGNFLSAMSFISDTWTSAYNQLGDMQVIVTFPLFLAIAMLFIGRMNSVIASGAMKSRKNNDKKGGGDVG